MGQQDMLKYRKQLAICADAVMKGVKISALEDTLSEVGRKCRKSLLSGPFLEADCG
jgi:hypothetical protein